MIVIVESPFAGAMETNRQYAIRACADCFRRGETPFASHVHYPPILDELKPEERERGITAGYEFWSLARTIAFYADNGWSPGMIRALKRVSQCPGRWEMRIRTFYGESPPIPISNQDEELQRWLFNNPVQVDMPA